MANRHSVTDEGDLRQYYAAIPNIVLQLGLNPFELALYVHFKQAAGDKGGVCWKSRATIARESGMSSGMVTKARQALEKKRPQLGGRPLIRVKEESSKTGGKPTVQVTITNIWGANFAKFSPSYHDVDTKHSTSPDDVQGVPPSLHDVDLALPPSQGDVDRETSGAPSYHDEQRHHTTLATSPHDHKEELLKKNPEETITPLARLLVFLETKNGVINRGKEAKAAKEILKHYTADQAEACYSHLAGQTWRGTAVTWTTVLPEIGTYLKRQDEPLRRTSPDAPFGYDKMGRKILSDDGRCYTFMGEDGTPTKRWHSFEAFAAERGIDPVTQKRIEKVG